MTPEAKIELAKQAATTVVGMGSYKIIKTIIVNNVEPTEDEDPLPFKERVQITAGSMTIAAMVADVSRTYTANRIDRAVAWCRKVKAKINDINNPPNT